MSLADFDRRYGDAIENGIALAGGLAILLLVICSGLQLLAAAGTP